MAVLRSGTEMLHMSLIQKSIQLPSSLLFILRPLASLLHPPPPLLFLSQADALGVSHNDLTSSKSPSVQIYTKKKRDCAAPFPPD